MKKKIIFITLFCLILFFLFQILFSSKYNYKNIYKNISYENRQIIKKYLKLSTNYIKYEVFYENYSDFPSTALIDLDFQKIKIEKFTNRINSTKAVGYLDLYNNKIILVSGNGNFLFLDKNNLSKDTKQITIKSNLKNIIKDELFFNKTSSSFNDAISVNDILIDDDTIYMSFAREIEDSCYNTSIIKAEMNTDFLEFEVFFTYPDCAILDKSKSERELKFNAQASGGRMAIYNEGDSKKMLFTTGTFLINSNAQKDESNLGKILLINLENGKGEIFAKGFRNPQGLLVKNDIILTSSHGPKGGDEINKILYGKNYGWPISSYGTEYRYKKNDNFKYKKNHSSHGFEEPVFSFVPSVGLSQIVDVNNNFNNKWKNNILVTSLKGSSIFRLTMNEDYSKIISKERIIVNERIRDIVYDTKNKAFYLLLEDSKSLTIIKNK
tara:strand:- start:833 stop:2149 length:1317 start_codon:yes stop_codon:yes gene_type:complete